MPQQPASTARRDCCMLGLTVAGCCAWGAVCQCQFSVTTMAQRVSSGLSHCPSIPVSCRRHGREQNVHHSGPCPPSCPAEPCRGNGRPFALQNLSLAVVARQEVLELLLKLKLFLSSKGLNDLFPLMQCDREETPAAV